MHRVIFPKIIDPGRKVFKTCCKFVAGGWVKFKKLRQEAGLPLPRQYIMQIFSVIPDLIENTIVVVEKFINIRNG